MCTLAIEICEPLDVSCLGASGRTVDDVFEAVGVTQEIGILDVVIFVTIYKSNSFGLSFIDFKAKRVKYLTEDLRCHLE